MRFVYSLGLAGLLIGALLWPTVSLATHVRAGEITTKRISTTSLTYKITFTAYYDEVQGKPAADVANSYTMCFGDGTTSQVNRSSRVFINGRTSSVDTYTIVHTYPGPGAYTIGITVQNRNKGTLNLPPPDQSENIAFFVSTTILINAALLTNSTPVMLNPPLDSGRVGQKFCHNPAAYDADGDSLAYRLSVPKTSLTGSSCNGSNIAAYLDPTQFSTSSESGGTPTFSINAITGDLCWDAPGRAGQYNFAFIIEEWRNGVLIGEITRDMQIIVVDSPNRRPLLDPIPNLCVEAGTLITQPITATDPDGQSVIITGYGGVFNVGADGAALAPGELIPPAYATLSKNGVAQASPASSSFAWQTNCNQLREQPYFVNIKVTDVPPKGTASLTSFQTFSIQLVGPAPKNLKAKAVVTTSGRAIQLTWDAYTCGATGTKLILYRTEGCNTVVSGSCVTGVPAGYTKIATLDPSATSYTDTTGLKRGITYSYLLVAQYPDANGGLNGGVSKASNQACLELPLLAPVITQVTVDSTGPNGQITVRWTRPIGLNPADLTPPFQYRLFRATGLSGTNYTQVAAINTNLLATAPDTIFVDRGSSTSALATDANAYRYQLEFYSTDPATSQLTKVDVTDAASSVRLAAASANKQINLSWQANVPWSNDNQTHRIYRSRSGPKGPFNLIAEVAVKTPTYTFNDTGTDTYLADGNTSLPLSADSSYCYRVLTRGKYTDTQLATLGILENYSQILCATPADTTKPCPPTLKVDSLNCASLSQDALCDMTTFTNHLTWIPTSNGSCDSSLAGYKIYYARYQQDTLGLLTQVSVPTQLYDHNPLSTVAGCYYVTAVSKRGLESAPSNKVCVDACPSFVLPNVFTPNGDGKNDEFVPLHCPRFVNSVHFVVYNRWGAKIYETTGPTLAWNGKSQDGADLPTGLYYYQCEVTFATLAKNAPPQVLKGWVQILREGVSSR